MMRRPTIVAALATLLLAASAHAQTAESPATAADAGFAAWLADYTRAAQARGANPAALAAVVSGLQYSPRVVELDRAQPDDSAKAPAVFSTYLSKRLDSGRIARGRAVKAEMAPTLASIEAKYGVSQDVILGIWGMESSYGTVTGNFDVPRALASLAYDGRRRDLFTRELDASVAIVGQGLARRDQLKGSWAGAMGQPQFLPRSYLAYSADGDGDGKADIWNDPADVAASIGNYLAQHGWRRGATWGMPVAVPANINRVNIRDLQVPTQCVRPMSKHSRWISVGEWRAMGVTNTSGKPWPADDVLATLVEPDGPGTAAYLTFGNYRAIMAYNCSNFYALSVALLGDALD